MHRRFIAALAAVVALAIAAGGNAVAPALNGRILFVGARAENFYSEVYAVAADGSSRANLTRNPGVDGSPAVSPNREQIAFLSERDGQSALYVMPADGANQRKLTQGLVDVRYALAPPVWSPTGRTLAVLQPDLSPGWCNPSYLYAVDVPSGERRQILHGAVGAASFSSDERFIVYEWGPCREMRGGFGVMRLDGRRPTFAAAGHSASWSPRGQRLLFLRSARTAALRDNIVTVDPSGRRRWVLPGVPARAPAWSPDGQAIAFFRRGTRAGLYVVRAGGRRPRQLARVAGGSAVTWSPDGAWLAFSAPGGTYFVRSTGHSLTRVGEAGSPPRWSPASRHFAFVAGKGAGLVADVQDGSVVTVTSAQLDAEVARLGWTSGERLVFASRRPAATGVFAVEPDGSALRQVAPDGTPPGRVSPDGARLAFVRDHHIWTVRTDGSDELQLTSGAVRDAQPAWSPDGERLAFMRGSEIFVVDSGGGSPEQITRLNGSDSAGGPAWSPDGGWIAFTSMEGRGLFAVRADGSGLRRIVPTSGLSAGLDPAWSPDGTKLALGGAAIAVVNADGTAFQPLTGPRGARDGQPAWSPDGKKIVFVRASQASGDSDLWTINVDGSAEARLTDGPWPDVLPTWLPVRP